MSGSETWMRRLALALGRVAVRLLPKNRTEWAKAMEAEFYHLQNDTELLRWAMGCFVAGITERFRSMGERISVPMLMQITSTDRRSVVIKKVAKISVGTLVAVFFGIAVFYMQLKDYQKVRISLWMDQQLAHLHAK